MAGQGFDISGQWDGHFDYPDGLLPSTAFLASIVQIGGHFSGTIIEPDLYSGTASAEAVLTGVIAGASVDFTKTYRRASQGYENPVDYVGQVEGDGDRIRGMWSLLELNGTFEMTRHEVIELAQERDVAEEVGLTR